MLIRRTEWFWLQLIMACLANAERQMQRRQSEVTDFHAKQYRLRNVTADTKINTLLLTLPQSDSPDVQYNVSSPDRFRVDDRGRVFTRVAGSDLLKDASSTSFAVNAFNTESSEMRVSKVLLLTGNQPPQFSDDSYEAYVYENAAQGSLVRAVVAQDPDTDPITYIIRKPGTRMDTSEYEMHPADGVRCEGPQPAVEIGGRDQSADGAVCVQYTYSATFHEAHDLKWSSLWDYLLDSPPNANI
ncbi:uncharacterized protein LOC119111261 [Pollicipes pollicipes]|uniref:uncharacterized protein LOC119111261 n=1 Tax=Pollicipes pollicipes TaxID=41117 RepID=UPI0018852D67|nr:uncharacterized protein LOC119111261 [Pollicipes pollicipes]